jgi:hypothetical protein
MNVTLKIFYSDNKFTPAIYFCSWRAAWELWFTLAYSVSQGVSGPHIHRVEIWDGGIQLDPSKGITVSLSGQY